jgi:hypothetical protein
MKTFLVNLDILITITLFLLVLFSLFFATKGILTENTFKGFKHLPKYSRGLIIVNILMLFVLIGQHYQNKYRTKIKDYEYQFKQDTRDSIVRVRYDSLLLVVKASFDASHIKTIATVTDVLGRYGYKLDSANRKLVSILKESPKTKVMLSIDPVLSCSAFILCEQTRGNSVYRIEICSYDAGSTGFDIKGNFLAIDSLNHKIHLGGKTIFDYENRIPKDSINGFYMGIDNYAMYSYVFVRLLGSYKNMDGSKTFLIDDVIAYNIRNKTFYTTTGSRREEIIDFIENNSK